ncbi:GntR family transcriptional regulator [Actinocorallia sp. API 0066]|uniref:GntR family transcriptional regulator n=1 Tax=Actinocorallia sp. API 0066 TaxID=2896846 RepID=UPI001E4E6819|nr:GntR family transcriptional regulator [Actinocorallia sp. API 0066]MCD0452931.1 GntR family transcriptional regulator [Actinocorallia sp. API 0066]
MGSSDNGELLVDTVYHRLTERIFSGELPPGTPLSVPALAAELDVSRSPVRESVQRLIYDGIAVHTPYAGAKVAVIDEESIFDVMQVREVLDGLAAREATLKIDDAGLAGLAAIIERQADLLSREPDPHTEAALDLEFHTAIRAASGNAALRDALHRLDARAHLYRSGLWSVQRNREHALAEHRAILTALDAGDPTAAQTTAAAHVAALTTRMKRWLTTHP